MTNKKESLQTFLKEEIKGIASELIISPSSAYAITRSSRSKTPTLSKTGEGEIRNILESRLVMNGAPPFISKRSIFMEEAIQKYNLIKDASAVKNLNYYVSSFGSRTQVGCSPHSIEGNKLIMFIVPDDITGMPFAFEESITNFENRYWNMTAQAFAVNQAIENGTLKNPKIEKISLVYVWIPMNEFDDKIAMFDPYSDEYKWLSKKMDEYELKVGREKMEYNLIPPEQLTVVEYAFDLDQENYVILENSLKMVDTFIDSLL